MRYLQVRMVRAWEGIVYPLPTKLSEADIYGAAATNNQGHSYGVTLVIAKVRPNGVYQR